MSADGRVLLVCLFLRLVAPGAIHTGWLLPPQVRLVVGWTMTPFDSSASSGQSLVFLFWLVVVVRRQTTATQGLHFAFGDDTVSEIPLAAWAS